MNDLFYILCFMDLVSNCWHLQALKGLAPLSSKSGGPCDSEFSKDFKGTAMFLCHVHLRMLLQMDKTAKWTQGWQVTSGHTSHGNKALFAHLPGSLCRPSRILAHGASPSGTDTSSQCFCRSPWGVRTTTEKGDPLSFRCEAPSTSGGIKSACPRLHTEQMLFSLTTLAESSVFRYSQVASASEAWNVCEFHSYLPDSLPRESWLHLLSLDHRKDALHRCLRKIAAWNDPKTQRLSPRPSTLQKHVETVPSTFMALFSWAASFMSTNWWGFAQK